MTFTAEYAYDERFSMTIYKWEENLYEFILRDNEMDQKYAAFIKVSQQCMDKWGTISYKKYLTGPKFYWLEGNVPDLTYKFIREMFEKGREVIYGKYDIEQKKMGWK